MNQRWRERRAIYRHPDEQIQTRLYEVASMAGDAEPKAFVERHHYARSFPAARFRYGLYRGSELVGVAVFSVPANDKVITNALPCGARDGIELGRLVLLDDVPGNGESYFVARCFAHLRAEGVAAVVSFSDPVPRRALDGQVTAPGHVGTVYAALNGIYTGRGTARTLKLLPDGTVLGDRTIQKIRKREQGHVYAAAVLERWGAAPLRADDDPSAWLRAWMPRVTRPLKHAGNHRYVWALDKRLRKRMPAGQAFPKQIDKEVGCWTASAGSPSRASSWKSAGARR